jgi:hypothetical protein
MNTRLLTGTLGIMLVLSPLTFAQDDRKPSPTDTAKSSEAKSSGISEDMRRAIEWERAKDRAAARQARIEARHPSNFQYADRSQNADRSVDDQNTGRPVKDTKAPGAKRDR